MVRRLRAWLLRPLREYVDAVKETLFEAFQNMAKAERDFVVTSKIAGEKELTERLAWLEKKLDARTDKHIEGHLRVLEEEHHAYKRDLAAQFAPVEAVAREALRVAFDISARAAALEAVTHRVAFVPANAVESIVNTKAVDPLDALKEMEQTSKNILVLQKELNDAQSFDGPGGNFIG